MDDPPIKSKPHTQICNEIITIKSIAEFIVKAIELSSSQRVLVVFDIDDVLVRTSQRTVQTIQSQYDPLYLQLGSELWQAMQRVQIGCGASVCQPEYSQTASCSHTNTYTRWEKYIPVNLTTWVNNLTKLTDVICLTARNTASRINLPQLGIHLCSQSNIIKLTDSQIKTLSSHGSSYSENIIYTNQNPKGEPLLQFCQASAIEYDTVLFVDNIYRNVENAVSILSRNGINILGFWLSSSAIGECQISGSKQGKTYAFFHGAEDSSDEDSDDSCPDIN